MPSERVNSEQHAGRDIEVGGSAGASVAGRDGSGEIVSLDRARRLRQRARARRRGANGTGDGDRGARQRQNWAALIAIVVLFALGWWLFREIHESLRIEACVEAAQLSDAVIGGVRSGLVLRAGRLC